MRELTDWFPANVKPVRQGVYMTKGDFINMYQHWNGEWWGFYMHSPTEAKKNRSRRSSEQHRDWRGLAKKP